MSDEQVASTEEEVEVSEVDQARGRVSDLLLAMVGEYREGAAHLPSLLKGVHQSLHAQRQALSAVLFEITRQQARELRTLEAFDTLADLGSPTASVYHSAWGRARSGRDLLPGSQSLAEAHGQAVRLRKLFCELQGEIDLLDQLLSEHGARSAAAQPTPLECLAQMGDDGVLEVSEHVLKRRR